VGFLKIHQIDEKDINCKIRHNTISVENGLRNDLGKPHAAVFENMGKVIDCLDEIETEIGNDFKTHTYSISHSLIDRRIVLTDYIKNVPIKKYKNIRREDFC